MAEHFDPIVIGEFDEMSRLRAKVPSARWETTTFLGAMRATGFVAPLCIEGAVNGEVFSGFTGSLTVIAHELAHGVIEDEGGLLYRGQSGALNESFADVVGALAEQHHLGQTADQASWLIGEGIFTDAVEGRALRSMAAPGTAYDDDVLGRDPQPAHMRDFVVTRDDNGGVHINSGIPNHAFYLLATALGGYAWERAGLIWYRTLSGALPSTADFSTFANATLAAAAAEYGEESEEVAAVRAAWTSVGVIDDARAAETAA